MKFATITPHRSVERSELLVQCHRMLDAQTLQPAERFLINDAAQNGEVDIVKRVKAGVALARQAGIDLVFIVEDDDFYPPDYFQRFSSYFDSYEFFGDQHSLYYNVKNRTFRNFHHPYRASLFTTGFKISGLNLFDWPSDTTPFLDIALWRYAKRRRKIFIDSGAVGIKGHGQGKTGGKGHIMRFKGIDTGYQLLGSKVTQQALEFYKTFAI